MSKLVERLVIMQSALHVLASISIPTSGRCSLLHHRFRNSMIHYPGFNVPNWQTYRLERVAAHYRPRRRSSSSFEFGDKLSQAYPYTFRLETLSRIDGLACLSYDRYYHSECRIPYTAMVRPEWLARIPRDTSQSLGS